ncbi:MAG: hypothetical protein WD208_02870 [Dehalococcoidia bacterium]
MAQNSPEHQPQEQPPVEEEKEDRRKRARRIIAAIRARVNLACSRIDQISGYADEIQDIVDDIRQFVDDERLGGQLPADVRAQLLAAADKYREAHDHVDRFADACKDLREALDLADKVLAPSGLSSMYLRAGVGVIAVAATVAFLMWWNPIGGNENGDPTAPPTGVPTSTTVAIGGIVSFAAAPEVVFARGDPDCTVLSWDVQDAESVSLDGQPVQHSSSEELCPEVTTEWVLDAVFVDGTEDSSTTSVEVVEATLPVEIAAVEVLRPTEDTTGMGFNTGYDGFDTDRGMWFKDVGMLGSAVDADGNELERVSYTWTTDQTDLQEALVGEGAQVTARLYSRSCEGGALHTITLTAATGDGQEETDERQVYIGQIC